jgi:outer membrane cobalamin receptor
MISRFFIVTLLLLFSNSIYTQNITISGYVKDSISNEKLIDATLYDVVSNKGVTTNKFGFYSISLPKNTPIKLHVSYIGYKEEVLAIDLTKSITKDFSLTIENNLEEVVLKTNKIEKRNDIGKLSIPITKIKKLPSIGGEPDLIKALQLMPGVQSGNEGSSSLYVRGGSPDQNLMLLDDVPLYYVSHMGGFVSVFNTDAINKIDLYKGGFPASYGGRLSSVVDITMKEGNANKFHGSGMIGIIASKLSIEGPIQKQKTSYIISYRRMLLDLVTKSIASLRKSKVTTLYNFYDLNAKINHKFSKNNHIYFSLYMGKDKLKIDETERDNKEELKETTVGWGNKLFAFRWSHLFSKKLFSNLTLSHTQYGIDVLEVDKNKNEHSEYTYLSGIADTNAKIDFTYYAHPSYNLKFGLKTTHHSFNPGQAQVDYFDDLGAKIYDTIVQNVKIKSHEINAYVENRIKLKALKVNLGLHYSNYYVNDKAYTSFEPRIITNWNFIPTYSLKASYTEMQQNIHLLSTGVTGTPLDLWMPATDKAPPEKSRQIALGLAKSSADGQYEFSIESYYKDSKDLIAYKKEVSYIDIAENWEEHIEIDGKGTSYGVEFLARKKLGKSSGWASYTLSKTQRKFTNLNDGKAYPYHYDRRHSINLVYLLNIHKNIDFSATWVFNSGKAISIAESRHQLMMTTPVEYSWFYYTFNYSEKNAFRMRAYHKLDIGVNFRKEKKWGERTWNISIYNVYNRQNPHYYYFTGSDNNDGSLKLMQQSLFPILPSVSYSFKF